MSLSDIKTLQGSRLASFVFLLTNITIGFEKLKKEMMTYKYLYTSEVKANFA